jgi:hypothetical protein
MHNIKFIYNEFEREIFERMKYEVFGWIYVTQDVGKSPMYKLLKMEFCNVCETAFQR